MGVSTERLRSLFIAQMSDKQTEIDFQMNANELYSIVTGKTT
jgi:hypothetical protein